MINDCLLVVRCGKLQPPVISFNDVAFSYSGKREDYLFSGLHFGIDSDSRIALVGPNGAGKSTLLKVSRMWGVMAGGEGVFVNHFVFYFNK